MEQTKFLDNPCLSNRQLFYQTITKANTCNISLFGKLGQWQAY
jgi:hypothetical protein